MRLIVIGLNHKTAPLTVRESLAFDRRQLLALGRDMLQQQGVYGVVGLSTCNRTEVYVEAANLRYIWRWVQQNPLFDERALKSYSYAHVDESAARHLMRVASGLDSMAFGEAEILGQLKEAYQAAVADGQVSNILGRLFQTAFAAAKRVRTRTAIGINPVSIAYLAVKLAQRVFSALPGKTVLVIGAGDTARLMVKHLQGTGVRRYILANRSEWRSREFARQLLDVDEVRVISLDEVPRHLSNADIVVTATSAQLPILGKGMVEHALRVRKHNAMFMIDLSVPRNIEPQVGKLGEVYLYGVDDLRDIAHEHQKVRYSAVGAAEELIDEELGKFSVWLRSRRATSTIQAFRRFGEEECRVVLGQALRQLEAGNDARVILQRFAHNLLNRLMHHPTVLARKAGEDGSVEVLEALEQIFQVSGGKN